MASRARDRRPRGRVRLGVLVALLLCGYAASVPPAAAQMPSPKAAPTAEVDLHLALAVDASGSVDFTRFELQKRGYAAAFRNPRVVHAIMSGPAGGIAVAMYQWTGPAMQSMVLPWTLLNSESAIRSFAAQIEASRRHLFGGGTSLSGAIDFGVQLLARSPFRGGRRVIDVSGDGSNNGGRSPQAARDDAVKAGININGLPILSLEPYLDEYFEENVIGGPGAFVVAADSYDTFGEAIVRKLVLEISGLRPAPGARLAAQRGGR